MKAWRGRSRWMTAAAAAAAAGTMAVLAGCMAPPRPTSLEAEETPFPDRRLLKAEAYYEAGHYDEALEECIALSRMDPNIPGLETLKRKVMTAQNERRALTEIERQVENRNRILTDAEDQFELPDTFGATRYVRGLTQDGIGPDGPLYKALSRPVSLHLRGAKLDALLEALSRTAEINIIADSGLTAAKSIDVDVDGVPLREILDYVVRNLGVQFYYGDNIIWVTAPDSKQVPPMETRIYRFKKGLQYHGSDWGKAETQPANTGDLAALTYKATVLPQVTTYVEEIIAKFIPETPGAQLHLDRNTHTLFVRNTPENLALIDRIVTALDINPPQVLIEARFIEVLAADLRELGIEWILDSPATITSKQILSDGRWANAPETVVAPGNLVEYSPYTSDASGAFPLGPQGSFGLVRDGNPPTANQGLNLTYQGVLTEPMFSAVLHALDISGKGHTLSVPRVTTLNNNPAKLRNGEDLRYFEEFQAQAFALVDANNQKYTVTALIPKGKPDIAELGITLVAVPSVGADFRTVSLLLTPTISRLEGFVSYQDESTTITNRTDAIRQVVVKLPIISRREVQTKVVVDSGETVVMGGLIDTVSQETVHKIPLLGDLPLLGRLFRRTDVTEQKKNLLIFVTATVLSERGESLLPHWPDGRLPDLDESSGLRRNEKPAAMPPFVPADVRPADPAAVPAAPPPTAPVPAPEAPEPAPAVPVPAPAVPVPAPAAPVPAPAAPAPENPAPAPDVPPAAVPAPAPEAPPATPVPAP